MRIYLELNQTGTRLSIERLAGKIQEQILLSKEDQLGEARSHMLDNDKKWSEWEQVLEELGELGHQPVTHYNTLQEALEHQNTLSNLKSESNRIMNDNDTYQEQINTLKETGMQNISWDEVNSLNIMKDHQDFL